MILNTGSRTDIPAYYSSWFYNRVKAGSVLARNPYFPSKLLRYRLDPEVVDILCFCTKNPTPMLPRLEELCAFRQCWYVTITPYGKDVEPFVPEKGRVMAALKELSRRVGRRAVFWRYDPVFLSEQYPMQFHREAFAKMAESLGGYINSCVVSFLDLYEKTKKNFPDGREVSQEAQEALAGFFAETGRRYGFSVRTCCERESLKKFGIDTSGCMTKEVLEEATGCRLEVPGKKRSPRAECNCLLGNDIGAYNTCGHGCLYCYANYSAQAVEKNRRLHHPDSPLLVGWPLPGEEVTEAKQVSYLSPGPAFKQLHF